MRHRCLQLQLITVSIVLSLSAFTLTTRTDASDRYFPYYWYSSAGGSSSTFVDENTVENEITRLESTFGGTYNTIAEGGTFAEEGFVVGGSDYPGNDPMIAIYQH